VYFHRDAEAAHHLAATAAGMHSLVLGEAQIQAQVRRALGYALAAGTAGPELRRLFESAISAGRQVRSRTALARGVAYSVVRAEVARFTDWLRRRETAADLDSLSIGIELARVGGEAGIRLPVRAQACRSCQ
jgi:Glutamyl-tRNAGlu reductase, N-terminal domain